jgi:hypothetical protein
MSLKKEVVCPSCDANDWHEDVSLLSGVPRMKCQGCNGYFTRDEMVEKDWEEPDAPLITAGILCVGANPSGNIFPRDVIETAVKELKPHMTLNRVLGTLDPEDSETTDTVELKDAATIVKTMYFLEDTLMADLEIMNTIPGESLKAHLRAGGEIEVVPRARGELTKNDAGENIVEALTLVTVDIYRAEKEAE